MHAGSRQRILLEKAWLWHRKQIFQEIDRKKDDKAFAKQQVTRDLYANNEITYYKFSSNLTTYCNNYLNTGLNDINLSKQEE